MPHNPGTVLSARSSVSRSSQRAATAGVVGAADRVQGAGAGGDDVEGVRNLEAAWLRCLRARRGTVRAAQSRSPRSRPSSVWDLIGAPSLCARGGRRVPRPSAVGARLPTRPEKALAASTARLPLPPSPGSLGRSGRLACTSVSRSELAGSKVPLAGLGLSQQRDVDSAELGGGEVVRERPCGPRVKAPVGHVGHECRHSGVTGDGGRRGGDDRDVDVEAGVGPGERSGWGLAFQSSSAWRKRTARTS